MSTQRWKWKLAVFTMLILLAVAWAIQRSRAGGRLQKYKAELRAQGEKLTFAELGIAGTTNGALGTKAFLDTVAEIGRISPLPDGISFNTHTVPVWTRQQPGVALTNNATATWAELARQVDAASASVSKLREILEHPATNSGWDSALTIDRPKDDLLPKRQMALWLAGAMVTELQRDRIDAAGADIHLLAQITHLHRDEPNMINVIIHGVIGDITLEGVWQTLQKPDLTDEALTRLNSDVASLEFVLSLDKALQFDRAYIITLMDQARNADAARTASKAPRWSALWYDSELDEAFYLEKLQTVLIGVRSLQGGDSWRSTQATLASQKAELDRMAGSLFRFRYPMTLISIPNLTKPISKIVQFEARKRLALAAIALRRHELRHHQLPPDLTALDPGFLPEVPRDIYDGKPLRYRLNKDGSFLLYSVGENLNDDGGSPMLDIIWQDVRPSLTN